jgi:hypothetical protein
MKGFTSREGREVVQGQLVGVHWNSHRACWSIVEFKSRNTIGRVLGYADQVTLDNCTVKIDQAKKKKLLETGVKDRHAFIVGEFITCGHIEILPRPIYYNPAKLESFVDARKYFSGVHEYIKNMFRVNMNYDFKAGRPVVTYL